MDPFLLVMLALIALMIFMMVRNGKKQRERAQQMQSNLVPGAEVMLQSGIYGTVESVDEEDNKVTVVSGTSTLVVHRQAIGQIVSPVDEPVVDSDVEAALAPDDDPAFGERLAAERPETGEDRVIDPIDPIEPVNPVERPGDADERPGDGAEPGAPKA